MTKPQLPDDAQEVRVQRPVIRDVPLERLIAGCWIPVRQVISVLRFEAARTRTTPRLFVWVMLVMFPVVMVGLLSYESQRDPIPDEVWGAILYGLIPQVVCLLGLLLWVSPIVNSELEGRTWIYLAVRPGGKTAMMLGKYLNGVGWTGSAALCGLTLALLVGRPDVADATWLYVVLAGLIVLSCLAYGSVYALLGAIFPRRAMVVSVGYMLIFEVLVSNIPAVVNQFTVQFRLFNVLLRAMDWSLPSRPLTLSESSIVFHIFILAVYVSVNLIAAALVLRWREYATAEHNQ